MHQGYIYLIMFIVGCILFVASNEIANDLSIDKQLQFGSLLDRLLYGGMIASLCLACLSLGMIHYVGMKMLGSKGHMLTGFYAILHELKIILRKLKTIVTNALYTVTKQAKIEHKLKGGLKQKNECKTSCYISVRFLTCCRIIAYRLKPD